jgi:DNA-binding response OmpR family regulator
MKILFVENHSIFAKQVIECFLNSHNVTVTPTLADARAELALNPYDVLLVDYDLDDGKGTELIEALRQRNNKVRIIGVSAHKRGNDALLQAGADAICSKMTFDRIQEIL